MVSDENVAVAPSPQQRFHPRHQLGQHEWLDQVVVGARLQTGDTVVHRAARRQHTDRDIVVHRAKRSDDGDAIEHRHVDVQHDGIGPGLGGTAERLGAVLRRRNVESGQPQATLKGREHVVVVIDNEHPG